MRTIHTSKCSTIIRSRPELFSFAFIIQKAGSSATRMLELRGDIRASHMGSRSTTSLLRNPTEVRHCSQHAGANVDFGDESAVDWAFLGNLKQLRALLLG